MEQDLMERVFRIGDIEPFEALPSGHKAWLLAQVGNLSAVILQSKGETKFPSPCHEEEEFIYVLEGSLAYEDGRVAGAGEAVYNLPSVAHPGKYVGRLLSIRVYPEIPTWGSSRGMMERVIKLEDVQTFYEAKVMTTRRLWLATENFSVVMNESQPGSRFRGVIHPEKEIVYVVHGQLGYENGRVVRDGEAVINLPDVLHPGQRGGTEPICSIEVKAPAAPQLLARLREC